MNKVFQIFNLQSIQNDLYIYIFVMNLAFDPISGNRWQLFSNVRRSTINDCIRTRLARPNKTHVKRRKKQMMSWKCRFYILFEQDKVEIYSLTDFQVKLGLEAFFTRTWSDIIK
jgi:hypothetical protein